MTGSLRKGTLTESERTPPLHISSLTSAISLIAKWKKTGYEKLCCLRCIQTRVSARSDSGLVTALGAHIGLGHELPRIYLYLSSSQGPAEIRNRCGVHSLR